MDMRADVAAFGIGAPAAADVPALIALVNALAAENTYLFVTPLDPRADAARLAAHLAAIAASGDEVVLVARDGRELVGLVTGKRGAHPARRGVVEIGIGVRPAWHRRGIGTALMQALERWARGAGCHRLQLPVVTANAAAIALYRKQGFVQEGTARAAALVGGTPLDEFLMAKLIA